jgi:hypothetical protein
VGTPEGQKRPHPISKNGLKPRQTDTVGQLQVMAAALLTIATKMRRNCDGRNHCKSLCSFHDEFSIKTSQDPPANFTQM